MDLSVIIPYAGEYPHVIHTVASVHHELEGRGIDYEIICVDNYCTRQEAVKIGEPEQNDGDGYDKRSREALDAAAGRNDWLKSIEYKTRLSHWQAKNAAVAESSGEFLWFCDSHCAVPRGVLWDMFWFYKDAHGPLNGSLHMSNTYKLLEATPNPYKLRPELEKGFIGYALTKWTFDDGPYVEVPCASTCGMMATREIYDRLGGWPQRYSYSGGEHFWNFVLPTMGMRKWLWTVGFLRHHGEPRDYAWSGDGLVWNQAAAMYMIGGEAMARKYIEHRDGRPEVLARILDDVLITCRAQREMIRAKQVVSIEEWLEGWK